MYSFQASRDLRLHSGYAFSTTPCWDSSVSRRCFVSVSRSLHSSMMSFMPFILLPQFLSSEVRMGSRRGDGTNGPPHCRVQPLLCRPGKLAERDYPEIYSYLEEFENCDEGKAQKQTNNSSKFGPK
jgi:hypothetical protein